ncbi:MAG TPA: hypothetical protein VJA00_02840, partial [Candidatus Omnitrophota bacterium]|nr:hypothetical protein [Candidatus Omnitrophota bacterium]
MRIGFIFFFCALVSILNASFLRADDKQEMEPELVFMPQAGPPRMVPKGSQGLKPVDNSTKTGETKRITSMESPGEGWEMEIVMMPQMGPPTWVPKGSQNVTPPVQNPNSPMSPFNTPMGIPPESLPHRGPLDVQMPGTFVFPPGQEPKDGNKFTMMSPMMIRPPSAEMKTPPVQVPAAKTDSTGANLSDVSGLELEEEKIEYRTGSEETIMRKIPSIRKQPNVHMKKEHLKEMDRNPFEEADKLKQPVSGNP